MQTIATTDTKPVNLDNKTVQRILSAALAVWTEKGYHGASLKDIADEAGVAKSLLHYHFQSKEHLLIELQADYSRRVAADIRERLAVGEPSLDNAMKALDHVWEAAVEAQAQFPFVLEVWRASLQSTAIRRRLIEFEEEMRHMIKEGIVTTLGPFAMKLRLSPERLADLLQAAIAGLELQLFLDSSLDRLRRVFEDFKTLVLVAILPPELQVQGALP